MKIRIRGFKQNGGVSIMNISQNLSHIIKKKKITQKALSKQLGVPTSTINNWIKLNRSIPSEFIIPICEFLDITPGSVSIMGLMNDKDNNVQLLIDREVLEGESLGCHPCINTSSLRLNTKEVMEKFLPAVHHEAIIVDLPRYEE